MTVLTVPSGAPMIAGGWYDEGSVVTLTAPPVSGNYRFSYWDVDGISQGIGVNPITVHMSSHTATAHYCIAGVTPSVGGEWSPITMQALTPANTRQMLALWISLISLMTLLATSFVYIRRKRRQS